MFRSYLLMILLAGKLISCSRDYPATAPYTIVAPLPPPKGGGLPTQEQPAPQKRLFLANDKVRVGIDLNAGGAITYLSEAGSSENMVNNSDLGRQLQTSIYAGPYPYTVNGKQPVYEWRNLGWNPVQTGDWYNHPSQIVSYQQGQNTLYVKTIPLIWPLNWEPADCIFEHWLELKDNTVHVRCVITVNRMDTTHYEARTQELPCVYLNGPYYRMVSYLGSKPFTNDAVSEFTDGGSWYYRYSPEHWTALLNDKGRGVGLYRPGEVRFGTMKFGPERVGGEFDFASGYMNTQPFLVIDHNGRYEYDYTVVVGSLTDIRQYVYSQPRPVTRPEFRFTNSRLGWYYTNTHDRGWPIQNELNVRWERDSLQKPRFRITSPMTVWHANEVPKLYIQAAFRTQGNTARLVWLKPEEHFEIQEDPGRYVDFPIIGDGQFRTYEINTSQLSGWNGIIAQIALTSPETQFAYEKGSTVRIRSITTTPP
ncbi:hypothetical protein [Spirosoma sp.]|uniref:hypothetical protein n=1 Tax=Spirosoma sp. TaxID=1899569 RepID=UPI003B3B10FA